MRMPLWGSTFSEGFRKEVRIKKIVDDEDVYKVSMRDVYAFCYQVCMSTCHRPNLAFTHLKSIFCEVKELSRQRFWLFLNEVRYRPRKKSGADQV